MTKLYLCGCQHGNKIPQSTIDQWQKILNEQNIGYTYINDLCGYVAKTGNALPGDNSEKYILVGCQPKALKNLVKKTGTNTDNFKFFHATESDFSQLENMNLAKGKVSTINYNDTWKPWYPVLDYDLCIDCQKCMNFCLFGVYKLNDEGKVIVENPENCKDLCPACSRTCPTNAIVFPKHHDSPIDGGEGEFTDTPEDFLSQIQNNNNVYDVLANRRKASGVSLFKANQLKIAEDERKQCNCKKN